MIGRTSLLMRQTGKPLVHYRYYGGGCPGSNLPWGLDSPMRFTLWWLIAGTVGFGAPFIVFWHKLMHDK